MSMTKEAIQHVQESANIPAIMKQMDHADAPLAVIPDSMSMKSLESYMENRNRFRASMATQSIDDFVAYCKKYDRENAECFVNADSMSAKTVIDLGTVDQPLHCDHTARVQLKPTALFKAVCNIHEERLSQKQLAEFIEDYKEYIVAFDKEGEVINTELAAQGIRAMTVKSSRELNSNVQDLGYSASALESMDVSSQISTPAGFRFTCVPYNGLGERSFELRFSAITRGDDLALSVRIKQFEAQQEEMAEEFKDILVDKLSDTLVETFIGSIDC
ncbi:DUF2303 domain-containing protein [Vibrio phage vB_VpP_1]|nr:DUF2303 domain-containing protein [Vibrio phage vB_VpP_1]